MKIVTSWDDGKQTDLWLADLLRKYQLPATFYIPSCCELTNEELRGLAKDFEIGGHTVTHPADMKMLSVEEIAFEVGDNRKELQNITGQKLESFCYPRGRYDERVIEEVKKAGFTNARTTQIGDIYGVFDPFKTKTTVHAYNRSEYNGENWLSYAQRYLCLANGIEDSVFHLWGHSREVIVNGLEKELEELFKLLNAYLYSKHK